MFSIPTVAPGLAALLALANTSPTPQTTLAGPAESGPPRTIRVVDVNGDGRLDRLSVRSDGSLAVALNIGGRQFEDVGQRLPGVSVAEVLTGDLNGDGELDLYLVSPGANVALVGDGRGGFLEDTESLGLVDRGDGRSAELADLDSDGTLDLLLHNSGCDVIFWGTPFGAFERDAATPEVLAPGTALLVEPIPADGETVEARSEDSRELPVATAENPASEGPRRIAVGARAPGLRPGTPAAPPAGPGPAGTFTASPAGSHTSTPAAPWCPDDLRDQATGACGLMASSVPTLGLLFPISTELFIDGATGDVGIGTIEPAADLHVLGNSAIGSTMIAPDQPASAGDSELLFAEDDDGTYGMKLLYDGGANDLQIFGRSSGADHPDPVFRIDRETGDARFGGVGTPTARLSVDGADTTTRPALDVEGGTNTAVTATSTDGGFGTMTVINTRTDGTAIYAQGGYEAVRGVSSESICVAVRGRANHTSGAADGVWGQTFSHNGWGVYGINHSQNNYGRGVYGLAQGPLGRGVNGSCTYSTGTNYGVYGYTTSAGGYGVYSSGDFGGSGAKYFLQPHPTDPSKEIRFVCMEGNEAVTFFRGSASLAGGVAVIEVPEEFRLVSLEERIIVQVTALGPASVWVESKDLSTVVVRGTSDIAFDYFVTGVRRGYDDLEVVLENHSFVPEERGVPFGSQYPEEYRQILVDNGILNPDFTPNETTAAAMGWTLKEPGIREAADAERDARIEDAEREQLVRESSAPPEPAEDR